MRKPVNKVLFVATVEIHIFSFHIPYLKYFHDQGYEVHVACAGKSDIPYCHVKHNIPFSRSPFKISNIKSLFMLKTIVDESNFRLIHCHTPMGGVIGRLAAVSARKKGTKVCYTAHGFHFYRGGPLISWIMYYPVEKILSQVTDMLITMNQEDYNTAVRKRFNAKAIRKVNGVGVELIKFQQSFDAADLKQALGLHENDFILLFVAELNKNKNQLFLLDAMRNLPQSVKLLLVGSGSMSGFLQKKAHDWCIEKNVFFLGYRNDVPKLLDITDVVVSSSRREGLPVNLIEAMAAGKPIIANDIRGNRDLVTHNKNGLLIPPNNKNALVDAVLALQTDSGLRSSFGQAGAVKSNDFSIDIVLRQMKKIYGEII